MKESINKTFNHFKVHTQYSICEGAIKIDQLKDFCKKNKIKSLGLSDTYNLSGSLEFSENLSSAGTQPIIGTQILFKYKNFTGFIPLIAKNKDGYKNIIELSSKSYLENSENTDPHCNFEDLLNKSSGIIVLTGSIRCLIGSLFNKGLFNEIDDVPLIASGGLGKPSHISDLLSISNCEAIASADFLHMKRGNIQELKNIIFNSKFKVRL